MPTYKLFQQFDYLKVPFLSQEQKEPIAFSFPMGILNLYPSLEAKLYFLINSHRDIFKPDKSAQSTIVCINFLSCFPSDRRFIAIKKVSTTITIFIVSLRFGRKLSRIKKVNLIPLI